MIRLQRIKTSDVEGYTYMERLMVASFPEDEYRDLVDLRKYTDTLPHFYNNLILDNEMPVGFISYWFLDDFYYVEHFAIDPDKRNGGYGRRLLAQLKEELSLPIVLEVELPNEEMAQRRIHFYERQHFTLWENEYFQPPYKPIYRPLPMLLMVNGEMDAEKDFEKIKKKLFQEVYYGYNA